MTRPIAEVLIDLDGGGTKVCSEAAAIIRHKLNHTAAVAVSTERYWQWITPGTPRGVTLYLLTKHGVAVRGILTADNIDHFAGWEPLARIPDGMIT